MTVILLGEGETFTKESLAAHSEGSTREESNGVSHYQRA